MTISGEVLGYSATRFRVSWGISVTRFLDASQQYASVRRNQAVRYFATVGELGAALLEFKEKYNRHWRLGKHGYRTAAQVRAQFDAVVTA